MDETSVIAIYVGMRRSCALSVQRIFLARESFFCVLFAVLINTSTLMLAASAPSKDVVPVHRVNLKSMFKAETVPTLGVHETPWVPIVTLQFLDDERVAVSLVVPSTAYPRLARRQKEDLDSPFRLRSVVLDAFTGKELEMPEWPSMSRVAGIVAANNRGFVTEAGDKLTLFSPNLQRSKELNLKPCQADGAHALSANWRPVSSWSGEHVLVVSGAASSKSCWLWIDAENLTVSRSWQDDKNGQLTASDDRLVIREFGQHFGDPPTNLQVASPGEDWKSIPDTVNAGMPQFVGEGLLYFQVLRATRSALSPGAYLLQMATQQISSIETPRNGGLDRAAVSRTGRRFVITIAKLEGSHPALDMGGDRVLRGLLVYDSPFHVVSYNLSVRNSKVRNPSVAISPDGRHLAVLGYPDLVLELFELPPP